MGGPAGGRTPARVTRRNDFMSAAMGEAGLEQMLPAGGDRHKPSTKDASVDRVCPRAQHRQAPTVQDREHEVKLILSPGGQQYT
jgi:hypothetical protein